jgi:hypothetical protein
MLTKNSILAGLWIALGGFTLYQEMYVACIICSAMSMFYVLRFKEENEYE